MQNYVRHQLSSAALKVTCVSTLTELKILAESITELTDNLSSYNPFYEEWMLLPAFEFIIENKVAIALVWSNDETKLIGVFPLEAKSKYHHCPIKYYSLWRHKHCFLGTPLVRLNHEQQCLSAFFTWLTEQEFGRFLFQFENIASDDRFMVHLKRVVLEHGLKCEVVEHHFRPVLNSDLEGAAYLAASTSTKHLKDLRKKRQKLELLGSIEFQSFSPSENLSDWIDQFLQLELRGWKGKNNTAMACHENERLFFHAIVQNAFNQNRLLFLKMNLNDQPIAMRCGFRCNEVAYSFKIAYEETLEKYSPGVLLELEHLNRIQDQDDIQWVDSCAAPGPSSLSRLWTETREISSIVVSTDTVMGKCLVSTAAALTRMTRLLRSRNLASRGEPYHPF